VPSGQCSQCHRCHFLATQGTGVWSALDDVAGGICQALPARQRRRRRAQPWGGGGGGGGNDGAGLRGGGVGVKVVVDADATRRRCRGRTADGGGAALQQRQRRGRDESCACRRHRGPFVPPLLVVSLGARACCGAQPVSVCYRAPPDDPGELEFRVWGLGFRVYCFTRQTLALSPLTTELKRTRFNQWPFKLFPSPAPEPSQTDSGVLRLNCQCHSPASQRCCPPLSILEREWLQSS